MTSHLERLNGNLTHKLLQQRIDRLINVERPRYRRLWMYYRNPMRPGAVGAEEQGSDRPYRQAQEWGLPSRITGHRSGSDIFAAEAVHGVARKEVVVENDIGWRIDTQIDYLFGQPVMVESAAPDPKRRKLITQLLHRILMHNGDITFLQQLALLGSVHGFVDVLVKLNQGNVDDAASNEPPTLPPPAGPVTGLDDEPDPDASQLERLARMIRFEIVEPSRALPLLSPHDYRHVETYVQVYELPASDPLPTKAHRLQSSLMKRLHGLFRFPFINGRSGQNVLVTDILTPTRWQRYHDEELQAEGANSLGIIPLVHIQNIPVPFEYGGASDVEPLIPLQDELNTRLSDRASRISLQSFKMYLGKGIDNFTSMPVAPGRMWMTDNEQAEVIEFGGDASSPSEDAHIDGLREALDKASSVTPIAAGVIKGRIGRLTSAAALRVTLLALLAKTQKKRTSYGGGIERMCALSLAWLDRAGLFPTTEQERRVELRWRSPIPENQLEKLREAEIKSRLGVPRETVLRELGY